MMQRCSATGCIEWAQYQVRKPVTLKATEKIVDAEGNLTGSKVVEHTLFELVSMLCAQHQKEQAAMPENAYLKFDFIGAAPSL